MHKANGSYGHRDILCRAAGLASTCPLRAYVQHGWTQRAAGDLGHHPLRLPVVAWSDPCAARSAAYGVVADHVIGSPFLYWLRDTAPHLLRRPPILGRSVLVVSPHSTRKTSIDFSHLAFASSIAAQFGSEAIVALHPDDAAKPATVSAYSGVDLRIWTNRAPMHSSRFLLNLVEILLASRLVVTPGMQTLVLYAAMLGRPARIQGEVPTVVFSAAQREHDLTDAIFPALPSDTDLTGWRDFAALELGLDEVKSAPQLAAILGLSSRISRLANRTFGLPTIGRSCLLRSRLGPTARHVAKRCLPSPFGS